MPRSAGVLFGGSSETVDRGARDKRDEMGWQQRAQSAASEQREERATTTIADPRRRGVLNSGVSLAGWCVQPRADERRESPQLRTVASRWRDALRATAASPLGRSEPTDGGRAPRSGGAARRVFSTTTATTTVRPRLRRVRRVRRRVAARRGDATGRSATAAEGRGRVLVAAACAAEGARRGDRALREVAPAAVRLALPRARRVPAAARGGSS